MTDSDPSPTPSFLLPDAPIQHLLSLRDNPMLATASDAELTALVTKLRSYSSPQTLSAKLDADSRPLTPKARAKSARAKALDDI